MSSEPKKRRYKMYLEPDVNMHDNISKTTEWRWGKEIGYLHNISSTSTSSTPPQNQSSFSPTSSNLLANEYYDNDNFTPLECNNESPQTDFDNRFDSDTESVELNDIEINNRENYSETEDAHEELMFPQAGLTQAAVRIMVLGLTLRHNLTNQARKDILELLRTCANLDNHSFSTNYSFAKKFDPPEHATQYTFYCTTCKSELISNISQLQIKKERKQCSNCNSTQDISLTGSNYFILTDISYALKMMLEDQRLFNMINVKESVDSTDISDVSDGELYKSLKKKQTFNISYNFNIDGAPIFASSKKSMWPIQVIINELPPEERFKNVIFGGIWIGNAEPKSDLMNTIMRSFAHNAKILLNDGIKIINPLNGLETIVHIIPLLCCVDSVARPVLQCRKQFNGYFGCSWCYHPGSIVKKQIKYPFEHDIELRSMHSHMNDLNKVVANKYNIVERGVKGPSSLLLLPHFDIVWSLPIDYMHGVILGVVRQLCDLWTTYDIVNKYTYYIGAPGTIKKLNERLLSFKPSQNIHRLPRSLKDKAKWKASEWKSWLLYYALPCLNGILEPIYVNHLALLVNAIFLLLQEKISKNDLRSAEMCLVKFVVELEKLYNVSAMTYNVHSLLHLSESVRKTGPLWASSAFPYESGIYQIKQQVRGPVGIEKQIAKKMVTMNTFLYEILKRSTNQKVSSFCTNLFNKYKLTSNIKKSETVTFIGSGSLLSTVKIAQYLNLLSINVNEGNKTGWFSYTKCIMNNVMYHSKEYDKTKKTDDTFIKTKSGEFVQILNFISSSFGDYMIIQTYITVRISYAETTLQHLHKIVLKSSKSLVPIINIENKCMHLVVDETEYLCEFPNKFEIQ